ncbi:MAG: flagellar basal body rod protein FlgC [Deltaproteobacteria bacterium]|nr:flagellar basal body rod protein FlgC [Deltaproteobacteria bacterium]
MDFSTSFRICASGLAAQRAKLDVVVSNLSNASTTSTPEGGPYKRKRVVFSTETIKGPFNAVLKDALRMVKVKDVVEDKEGFKMVYDPAHPDADARGMVAMPNVNVIQEMADMIMANRAYEASVTAFDATKNMALKTLEMGR